MKDALAEMAKVVGDTDNIAGGKAGALQTDFPTSVANVFSNTAEGCAGDRGRLRPAASARRQEPLKPETGFNVFPFPSIGDSPRCRSSAAATSS